WHPGVSQPNFEVNQAIPGTNFGTNFVWPGRAALCRRVGKSGHTCLNCPESSSALAGDGSREYPALQVKVVIVLRYANQHCNSERCTEGYSFHRRVCGRKGDQKERHAC